MGGEYTEFSVLLHGNSHYDEKVVQLTLLNALVPNLLSSRTVNQKNKTIGLLGIFCDDDNTIFKIQPASKLLHPSSCIFTCFGHEIVLQSSLDIRDTTGLDRLIHIYRVILIINCCWELSPFC